MTEIDVTAKRCSICKEDKPLSQFYRAAHNGRHSECKVCSLARQKEYQARKRAEMDDEAWLAHKASIVAKYRATPEGREQSRLHNLAQSRALSALAEMHPDAYRALLRQERSALRTGPRTMSATTATLSVSVNIR